MFERLAESSRAVLVEAQDLAIELGSGSISAGHLLYGCAEGREETAGRPLHECGITGASIRRLLPHTDAPSTGVVDPAALRAIGIDYEGVRAAVEDTFGPGALETAPDRRMSTTKTRKPRFTPEAKRSLELSLQVAVELSPRHGLFTSSEKGRIMPGHLLLGLLRLDSELVSSILHQAGVTVAALSAAVLSQLAVAA
jgi:Clp amino terminal domain, pathogenicity island component